EVKYIVKRKTVLLGQGDVQTVVSGCGLQLEVEASTETLAQRKSPGLVDAAAEWRVDDQLHSAAFIEETLSDDGCLSRHSSKHSTALQDVLDRLLGARVIQAALFLQPTHGRGYFWLRCRKSNGRSAWKHLTDPFPQIADMGRQFLGAGGSFSSPEWH